MAKTKTIAIQDFLMKHHIGPERVIQSRQLESYFDLNTRSLRRIIHSLRCKGVPICSDENGYYVARIEDDLEQTIAHLNSRIEKIANARNGLLKAVGAMGCGDGLKVKLVVKISNKGS